MHKCRMYKFMQKLHTNAHCTLVNIRFSTNRLSTEERVVPQIPMHDKNCIYKYHYISIISFYCLNFYFLALYILALYRENFMAKVII